MLDVLNVLMDIFPTNGMLDRLRYFLIVIGSEVIDGDSIERFRFNEVFMVLNGHSFVDTMIIQEFRTINNFYKQVCARSAPSTIL